MSSAAPEKSAELRVEHLLEEQAVDDAAKMAGVRMDKVLAALVSPLRPLQQSADGARGSGQSVLQSMSKCSKACLPAAQILSAMYKIVVVAKKISEGLMKRPDFAERRPTILQHLGLSGPQYAPVRRPLLHDE